MDAKQRAIEQDLRGECIVCGVASTGRRRGLCVTDYTRYRTALLRCEDDAEREAWEEYAVETGRLLPSRQGQRGGVEDDVFAVSLEEFRRLRKQRSSCDGKHVSQ
jgi:hypothetical protein